jgi:hypothetical protein
MPEQAQRENLPLMPGAETMFNACNRGLGRAPQATVAPARLVRRT